MSIARIFRLLKILFPLLTTATLSTTVAEEVYSMSNGAAANEIVRFSYAGSKLSFVGRYMTGGVGTAGPLENQNGLVKGNGVSSEYLFAVNAGSDDISVFRIEGGALTLTDRAASGGAKPVSIAVNQRLVYVLNGGRGGVSSNISGFRLSVDGKLVPLAKSTRDLPTRDTLPAQIQFIGGRKHLVVTEQTKDRIDLFTLGATGVVKSVKGYRSAGSGPFGFAIKGRRMYVSELNPSALSVYQLSNSGRLVTRLESLAIPNQSAACWVVLARRNDRSYQIYVSNTGSDTLSRFSEIGEEISLVQAVASRTRGSAPTDMFVSKDNRSLFVLNAGGSSIDAFSINQRTGSLKYSSSSPAFAPFGNGLIAIQ